MINSQDIIKKGVCIRMDGKIYVCVEFLHVKPGKGNTIMRTTLKDVVSGRVLERRFNIGEKIGRRARRAPSISIFIPRRADYVFMNQETFEQINVIHDLIIGVDFMKEGDVVDAVFDASTETLLFAEMPQMVVLEVTYSEPGVKGDTATNAMKPAKVETGAEVRVPLFINTGDKIKIDTTDGSYKERVK
jgi:elongation factor P